MLDIRQMMPSCRVFLVCIILVTLYGSVDSKQSHHRGSYMCKYWKSCPLQIPLKKWSKHMSVRLEQICDGTPQCPCGDDEENCDPNCPSQLRCGNKTCIPAGKVCDGTPDCQEHEDEMMCPKPEPLCPGMFACLNGTCIPAKKVCDESPDCGEKEDESMCPPAAPVCPGMFACLNGTCIPAQKTCDGNPDCGEKEDESMCPPAAAKCPGMFACINGTCIPAQKTCDGNPDCEEKEDETMCPQAELLCPGMFACLNRTCIPANKACDTIQDCQKREDEENCAAAPFCRTCQYSEAVCYTTLTGDVSEDLFLSTTTLALESTSYFDCEVACDLNINCETIWTTILSPGDIIECRLSALSAQEIANTAGSTLMTCDDQNTMTYTQSVCRELTTP